MPERFLPAVLRFLVAYDALVALAEDVEDEWSYVNDLSNAWRARLQDLESRRADELLTADAARALDALIGEIGSIRDPHRAIDWLSTAPQVALLALGEQP